MKVAVAAGLVSTMLTDVSSVSGGGGASGMKVNWARETSAKAGGGMAALIKAAKKEGHVVGPVGFGVVKACERTARGSSPKGHVEVSTTDL